MKKLVHPINRCTIDITEKCNLKCGYCFTFGVGRRDLTYEQGKKTIDWLFKDEISQSDVIDINWWGGEPFVNFEQMKVLTDYAIEKAVKEGKRVSIGGTSNTTLMTKEAVDWMLSKNAYFMMSIDGSKDIQDFNRPAKHGSSWDMIEKNLPYIMNKIPFMNSRMSPTPQHIHRMAETFKYLYDDFNIQSQMFSPVSEVPWTEEQLQIAEEQLKLIADMIIEKRLQGKRFNVKHLDDGARIIESGKSVADYPCGAGRFYVGISVDGVIYPCHRFNKYDGRKWQDKAYIGTIDDGILRPDFRNQFVNYLNEPIPNKCKECDLYGNLCDRCCYAVSYDLLGNIFDPPEFYCKWRHIEARVSRYYHKKLKENNLPIPGMERGNSMGTGSCICNNMCYAEGTPSQVINVDPNGDGSCICNNTNYSGGLDTPARKLTSIERHDLLQKLQTQNRPQQQGQFSQQGLEFLTNLTKQLNEMKETNKKLLEVMTKISEKL